MSATLSDAQCRTLSKLLGEGADWQEVSVLHMLPCRRVLQELEHVGLATVRHDRDLGERWRLTEVGTAEAWKVRAG